MARWPIRWPKPHRRRILDASQDGSNKSVLLLTERRSWNVMNPHAQGDRRHRNLAGSAPKPPAEPGGRHRPILRLIAENALAHVDDRRLESTLIHTRANDRLHHEAQDAVAPEVPHIGRLPDGAGLPQRLQDGAEPAAGLHAVPAQGPLPGLRPRRAPRCASGPDERPPALRKPSSTEGEPFEPQLRAACVSPGRRWSGKRASCAQSSRVRGW